MAHEFPDFAAAGCQGLRVDIDAAQYPHCTLGGVRNPHRDLAQALIPLGFTAGSLEYHYAPGITLDNARVLDILRQAAEQLPWLPGALRSVSIIQVQNVLHDPLADLREAVTV